MKQIWSKFFWSDWANDPALRVCSLAAQGLWMRLLCLAAQHDPPGYVALKGQPLSPAELARVAGCSEPEAQALIDELDRAGVFSRDNRGRIHSRRMIRDSLLSRKRSKAGRIGALVTHGKPLPSDKLPRQNAGNGHGKSLDKPRAISQIDNPDRTELPPRPPPAKPVPDPTPGSAMDAVKAFAAARTKFFPDRKELDPAARKARWQQKVFAHAKACLTDAEYQRLVTEAANDTPEGQAWMNRLSDEMRAIEAERERRSTA